MKAHPFDRYADFTDLQELKKASARPLRKSIRANLLKSSKEKIDEWGKSKNWKLEPISWVPEGFFIDREDRAEPLGKDLLHLLGHTYMQEASSMLPVALLDPQPHENVLDMSAAPGSKTTHIASRMRDRGVIVANDVQEKRIWSLISNLYRSGVTSVVVTKKVGQWFGGHMTERFDRVLCDAPCTAEGTVRKDPDALKYCSADNRKKMVKLQTELLSNAVHAAKVGGRIVYSTCTLSAEENEGVIASVLSTFSDQIKPLDPGLIVDCDLLKSVKDSLRVQDEIGAKNTFPAVRLWPQTFDTEGFFVCVLEKTASTRTAHKKTQQLHRYAALPTSRVNEMKKLAEEWYGCSFLLDDDLLIEGPKDQLMVLPKSCLTFALPTKAYFAGLPFGKNPRKGIFRLSHEMAVLRGAQATEHRIDVTESQLRELFFGKDIEIDSHDALHGDIVYSYQHPALNDPLIVGRGMKKGQKIFNRLPREVVHMFT